MNSTTTSHIVGTRGGAPMLNADHFKLWLRGLMRLRGWTILDVARLVYRDEAAVRRWLAAKNISERTVEHAGIELAGHPRLAADLYPELDEWQPVGAEADCGGDPFLG
jgi:hypothetical protein